MNKQYTYVDGKCIIQDEQGIIHDKNGNPRVEKYTDKLDEILVQENVIEELESELKEINYTIPRREKIIKSEKQSLVTLPIFFTLMPFILQQIIKLSIGKEIIQELLANGEIVTSFLKVFFLSVSAIFGTMFTLSSYVSYKSYKNILNGELNKKKLLEECLGHAKQKLQEMKKIEQEVKLEEEVYQKTVQDLETLRNIRSYINLYYNCGFNQQKYARYYKEGKLNEKLSKYYTENGIKLIEEYIEESEKKSLTLSK